MNHFKRRIFTYNLLKSDLSFLISNRSKLIVAMKNEKLGKKFSKKIMMVTTAINGCTICAWAQTKMATKAGVDKQEIRNILNSQFETEASDYELLALQFAQEFAETNRYPSQELLDSLEAFYGNQTAQDIMLLTRLSTFGNLTGNTFDAFISRLKGKGARNSNQIFEFLFFILLAPFLLPILPLVHNKES